MGQTVKFVPFAIVIRPNSIREHSSSFVKFVSIILFVTQHDRVLTSTHNNDLGIG